MKSYSEQELASLIIHELLHATAYLNNHSQFNEELAEFVGTEGARLYMEKYFGPLHEADEKAEAEKADGEAYRAFIRGLTEELDLVYKSDASHEEKLEKKALIIEAAQKKFDDDYEDLFKTENYRGVSKIPVNNAYLELYRLYYEESTYFKDLYEKSGGSLPAFIAAAKNLKNKGSPKEQLEKALQITIIIEAN
jgi:predicted aminopeptidase